jgi:[protein-PII] uridylyltransferase
MTSAARPAKPATTDELRAAVQTHRTALAERIAAGEDGTSLGKCNARFLETHFKARFDAAANSVRLGSKGVALAAVGSFGRGAVALRSDADVVLVVNPKILRSDAATAFAEALLYPLWDATFAVGHQVLSSADALPLAQTDLATATELLDMRFLAGDESLVRELVSSASEGLFGEEDLGEFIERIEAETTSRHERFGGSVYLLEPDVKAGAGGLRDIDGIRWASRARYHVGDGEDPQGFWSELVRLGVLVPREAHEIRAAEEFFWRVRNRLHGRAGRKADRLGFAEQETLGVAMGFSGDRPQGAERLMQEYYVHARTVIRARSSLFERLKPRRRRKTAPPVDLGGGVRLFDGHVTLVGISELQQDPALAMRVYAACVKHRAPVLPFARDAIARAAADPSWCEALRSSSEAAGLFVDLVCAVSEAGMRHGSIVGELHDVGLVVAMVPEFLPVIGQVHHDVYHVLTVDAHSLAAVDRLRQIARGELAGEFALATRLAAEISRPRPLFMATLLHDIGKGWPDSRGSRKSHSTTGAALCGRILPRLGFTQAEVQEVRELVLNHLVMYHVATRRDLDDAGTIDEFCSACGGQESLRHLYLLTVADLSTTSPTAMTSWKARMLDELYFASESHFAGHAPREDAERFARAKKAVQDLWTGSTETLDRFVASMPDRYLLANAAESIAVHARAVEDRDGRAAHLVRVPSPHADVAELCVVADDRPGLLARVAGALTANRLEVLAAQVYSRVDRDRGEAVDLFWVRDKEGGADGVEPAMAQLSRDLESVCSGRLTAAALLAERVGTASPWRERPSPAVPTEVLLDDRASPRHTVVEVFAKDRPGLLYTLARALHEVGISIALSKINTEGTRVIDVFYVTELDGQKVAPGSRTKEVRDALIAAIGQP